MELTKRDLHKLQSLHRQIQRDQDQLYILRELAAGDGSKPFDNVRVQSSPPISSGNRFAEAAADLEAAIVEEVTEMERLQTLVEEFLETLEDAAEIRIIQLRYISGYNWVLISNLTGYTERHVFRIHNKIIEALPEE